MNMRPQPRKDLASGSTNLEPHFNDADVARVMPDLMFLADWEKGAATLPSAFLRIRQIRRAMPSGEK